MKVLVGLGNPGSEYTETPHNLGFKTVECFAEKFHAEWKTEKRFNALVAKVSRKGEIVWLLKPQTYMNLSGECVGPFLKYYGMTVNDIVVFSDDCDLPAGRLRIRPSGSAGGHNGLKNIIEHLGSQTFARVRLGAGREPGEHRGLKDFVLHRYTAEEKLVATATVHMAVEAALCWLDYGISEAQNSYNAWRFPNNQE